MHTYTTNKTQMLNEEPATAKQHQQKKNIKNDYCHQHHHQLTATKTTTTITTNKTKIIQHFSTTATH